MGGTAFLVGGWVGRAWVVARVLAVEAALGDCVGFCSGRTVLGGPAVPSGLLLGAGSPLVVGCVGSGDAEEG